MTIALTVSVGLLALIIVYLNKKLDKIKKESLQFQLYFEQQKQEYNTLNDLILQQDEVNKKYHERLNNLLDGKLNFIELPKDPTDSSINSDDHSTGLQTDRE